MELDVDMDKLKDELTRDMLNDMGDVAEPSRAEGWRSFAELYDNAIGLSESQLRTRLEQKTRSGEYSKIVYKRIVYYKMRAKQE